MNLKNIFRNNTIDTYNEDLEILWYQIVRINSFLVILEKIMSFPFRLFSVTRSVFWSLTIEDMFSNSVLIMWRLLYDTGKDVLGLRKLKSFVFQNIIDDNIKRELSKAFRESNIENRVEDYREKISLMRTNKIAHTIKKIEETPEEKEKLNIEVTAEDKEKLSIDLKDLKDLKNLINQYFAYLELGDTVKEFLPIDYLIENEDLDIDDLLSHIAYKSALVHMPENNPAFFKMTLDRLSDSDIETINYYRKKFGLKETNELDLSMYR